MALPDIFGGPLEKIALDGGELHFWPDFLPAEVADRLCADLLAGAPWVQSHLVIAGCERPIPRLNVWYGDPGADYSYSGARMLRHAWPAALTGLKNKVEARCATRFNSALLNLYRNGRDSVAWHSDDEPELGPAPLIATLSLGAERALELRAKADRTRLRLSLPAGSLLLMAGALQRGWQHRIAKTTAPVGPRISITWRQVMPVARLWA